MAIKFLNTVAVDTNVLYVDAASNEVGIGTTSPGSKLEVVEARSGSSASDQTHYTLVSKSTISSGTPGTGGIKVVYDDGSNEHAFGLVSGSSSADFLTSGPMHWYTNSDLNTHNATGFAMTIDTSQRVGIGTTSPTADLHVDGSALITSNATVRGDLRIDKNPSSYPTAKLQFLRNGSTSPAMGEIIMNDNPGHAGMYMYARRSSSPYTTSYIELPTSTSYDFEINLLGSNVLTIDTSSGNTGIGTTNPSEKLEVVGNAILDNSNAKLKIKAGGSGTVGSIDFTFNTDSTQYGLIDLDYDSRTSQGLRMKSLYPITLDAVTVQKFLISGSEKMRIASSGNAGIGENNPQERLHISGSVDNDDVAIRIDNDSDDNSSSTPPSAAVVFNTASNNGYVRVFGAPADTAANHKMDIGATASNSYLTFSPSTTEKMRIASSGNVGINVTSPQARLHVDAPSTKAASLTFGAQAGQIFQNENSEFAFGLHNASPYPLYIQGRTNADTARQITLNPLGGNIGIGTLSPDVSLEVVGNGIRVSDGTDQGVVYFRTDRNDTYIKENGNYQIETAAPSGIIFECDSNSNGFGIFNIKRQGASRFYITDGGNVGIGTTSPAEKLTVSASDNVAIRINSTKNGTWTTGQSLGALEFFGNDASGGQGAGLKGKIDLTSFNQYGAAFDMKFFTSNGSTDPTTEDFKIAYDGGIFAPNLLGSSASNPDVRYNTSTDELYYNSSSIRYKEDVTDLENSLDKINNLRPVKFKDKQSGEYATGLIAEEVVNVLPELVFKRQIEGFNEPQIDGVSYGDLHAYYIKAIQQLKSEIETLKSQIN